MDLLQEYKELYYKEIEFADRLNAKIANCITFLTILGSAQILLWTQLKNFNICYYTIGYTIICTVATIMFLVCIAMFFRTYSGYKTQYFPIKEVAKQNTEILNSIPEEQKDNALEVLSINMANRFINDAIHNREKNFIKNNRHRHLIQMIMATFIVTLIAFSFNVGIDYYETQTEQYTQETNINVNIGGEIDVR